MNFERECVKQLGALGLAALPQLPVDQILRVESMPARRESKHV